MALKRHHKIILGGVGTLVIIAVIGLSIMMYSLYVQQVQNYNSLNDKILELQTNSQAQISSLSENVLNLQSDVASSQEQLQQELNLLKASAGEDFSGIIEDAVKSVVTIKTSSAQGTGFIITSDGYLITNAHVLADDSGYLASNIQAITSEQGTIDAEFIGYDSELDIALLKIPGQYEVLELGNSNNVEVGEKVIAIGNPLGLQFSVSEGIVSAVHRKGANGLEAYIQTDAALNPGNSGGPLINKQGEVIGINNFKVSGGESLGFALESNYIKQAINQISQENLNGISLI
ncbi:MAG: trypsin-like peptidase domain-containing protein [Candidatus Nanoarchaeia archaeon]|nr:trypsin-like peptidase domain-containing protein [Candidatus Nanoarchaeia archaeon]